MLPFEMLVITNYTTIIRLNLNDSLPALIIPFLSLIHIYQLRLQVRAAGRPVALRHYQLSVYRLL